MILRLETDPADITIEVIRCCWVFLDKVDFACGIAKNFFTVLVCNMRKSSSKFLDIVDVKPKIHYTD